LNGQTVRDLNGGNRFIRGNSTSGGTGGAATHQRSIPNTQPTLGDEGATDQYIVLTSDVTDAASSLPPYTDMVWIMRIK